jgi:hypothetical protein
LLIKGYRVEINPKILTGPHDKTRRSFIFHHNIASTTKEFFCKG